MNPLKFYITPNTSTYKALVTMTNELNKPRLFRPKNNIMFVLLCGANKEKKGPSERRKAILEFAKAKLPNTQFFLAETLFAELTSEEKKETNLLALEEDISRLTDKIVIILESNSAFCELGAFSIKNLRKQLVIINNSKYNNSDSFINEGPIKAIKQQPGGESRIITYPMSRNGIYEPDPISSTYSALYKNFLVAAKPKTNYIDPKECNPAFKFSKDSIRIVHDLIYITGPITYPELIEVVLIKIFGKADFKIPLKLNLGMLIALDLISKDDKGYYRSSERRTYFKYSFNVSKVSAAFKMLYLKYFSSRIFEK